MNTDTGKNHPRVLFDTNILISALVFGGNPARILMLALDGEFRLVTSNILIAELIDVVNKLPRAKSPRYCPSSLQERAEYLVSEVCNRSRIHPRQAEYSASDYKKFPLSAQNLELLKEQINNKFDIVSPTESLNVLNDTDDNRVLEAAIEGECEFIVTGDRELLDLGSFKKIKIISVSEFLKLESSVMNPDWLGRTRGIAKKSLKGINTTKYLEDLRDEWDR